MPQSFNRFESETTYGNVTVIIRKGHINTATLNDVPGPGWHHCCAALNHIWANEIVFRAENKHKSAAH